MSEELFLRLFGKSLTDVRDILSKDFNERDITSFLDCYFKTLLKIAETGEMSLFPGTISVLERLKNTRWKLALCTNVHTPFIDIYRRIFNLDRYFQSYYWADKDQEEIIPKEKMIKNILKEFNTNYAVMIGDRSIDINAAQKNDILTVGCLYGFGSREELKNADYLINSIEELPDLLFKISKSSPKIK